MAPVGCVIVVSFDVELGELLHIEYVCKTHGATWRDTWQCEPGATATSLRTVRRASETSRLGTRDSHSEREVVLEAGDELALEAEEDDCDDVDYDF